MGVATLWIGDRPQPLDVGAMMVAGLALAGVVLVFTPMPDWRTFVLALLAWDIGAGMVSNATRATREAWRNAASRYDRISFIVSHLTVYPVVLFWLADGEIALALLVCAFLIAKVMLFISGMLRTSS